MSAEPAREILKFKRQTSKKRLNKRVVDGLKLPPHKPNGKPAQEWHYDQTTARLAICVWSTGAKTWYWVGRLKNAGMIRYRLGNYPETTPDQAKGLAADVSRDVLKGIDPRAERQQQRDEWTLERLFTDYLERHAKIKKRTWAEDEAQFRRYCGRIKTKKLSTITESDMVNLHNKVGTQNGRYAANRLLALLSKVFTFGKRDNPAKGVERFDEESRERFLSADELRRFFDAIEPEKTVFRDFFWMLLLTGARKSNLLAMRFSQVNQEEKVWRIPTTKNKAPLSVPLVPEAVEILEARRRSIEGDWVFPARCGKKPHITEPKEAWKRILDRANLQDVHIHDLRRTLGSWQAATGASLPIIGKTLGHKSQQVTQVYARLNIDPVRQAVEIATAAMMAAAKPKEDNQQNAG
jgi:integrase